ncbi:MAG: hypothetical protein JNL57_06690 [Bacteroidetes bacterium]|nr:hypothetical protein [Bacteroidota bacterium]
MRAAILILVAIALLPACKKSSNNKIDNPYNTVVIPPRDTKGKDSTYDPQSLQGLHRDLFAPTCANSGCHDGTFEPDFRTVQSTYASLINIKPIKNDTAGTFNARVLPGNADASILIYRMTVDLGGNSGIMPIVLDPGSTYPAKKAEHLANLKAWINKGAPDFSGKMPGPVDFPPQILGVQGLVGGNAQGRGGKYEPLVTSSGQNLELWFSLADDKLAQGSLTNMTINWSTDPNNYDTNNEKPLQKATSKLMSGLYAPSTSYEWYYTFSTAGLNTGDVIWFRIHCSDGVNDYYLPNVNSMFFLKKYFAVRIP